jgi:hypothetical protein
MVSSVDLNVETENLFGGDSIHAGDPNKVRGLQLVFSAPEEVKKRIIRTNCLPFSDQFILVMGLEKPFPDSNNQKISLPINLFF